MLLNRMSAFLPRYVLLRIYKQTILPILDYCSIVWHECGSTLTKRVEKLQNRALRIILQERRTKCTQEMRSDLNLLSLYNRRRFHRFLAIFKILYKQDCSEKLYDIFKFRSCMRGRDLRDNSLLHLPAVKTSTGQSTFQYAGTRDWNSLPRDIRDTSDFKSFKNVLFKYLQSTDVDSHICTVV